MSTVGQTEDMKGKSSRQTLRFSQAKGKAAKEEVVRINSGADSYVSGQVGPSVSWVCVHVASCNTVMVGSWQNTSLRQVRPSQTK
jgi:hypothetical protein